MPDKKIVAGVARTRKRELTEGLVPYYTQKGIEEFAAGRAVKRIGGAVKKGFGKAYPGARGDLKKYPKRKK